MLLQPCLSQALKRRKPELSEHFRCHTPVRFPTRRVFLNSEYRESLVGLVGHQAEDGAWIVTGLVGKWWEVSRICWDFRRNGWDSWQPCRKWENVVFFDLWVFFGMFGWAFSYFCRIGEAGGEGGHFMHFHMNSRPQSFKAKLKFSWAFWVFVGFLGFRLALAGLIVAQPPCL